MPISIINSTVTSSSTPTLIGPNPIPDGDVSITVSLSGAYLFSTSTVTYAGNCNWWLFSSIVGLDFGNTVSCSLPDGSIMRIAYVYISPTNNGFYISSDNSWAGVDVNMWATPTAMTGVITCNNVYNSTGIVNNSLTWCGSTITSLGTFTVDISSAGFTNVTSVQAIAVNNTTTVTAIPLTSLNTVSATTITGNVVHGTALAALGDNTLQLSSSGLTVYVTVYGN